MKVWVNGRLVDADDATVSVFDHGLTVGDGVFETAKVVGGVPVRADPAPRPAGGSAAGLGLPAPDDGAGARRGRRGARRQRRAPRRAAAAAHHGTPAAPSPLGSDRGDAGTDAGRRAGADDRRGPIDRRRSSSCRGAATSAAPSAGVKTTSYAENVVALAHAKAAAASEAVFANTAGKLCEGTGSNVFVVLDGELVTPPLASGCLAGVTRGAGARVGRRGRGDLPIGALAEADEVFLTSSTRDVQAVHGRGRAGAAGRSDKPGPVTAELREMFAARSGRGGARRPSAGRRRR